MSADVFPPPKEVSIEGETAVDTQFIKEVKEMRAILDAIIRLKESHRRQIRVQLSELRRVFDRVSGEDPDGGSDWPLLDSNDDIPDQLMGSAVIPGSIDDLDKSCSDIYGGQPHNQAPPLAAPPIPQSGDYVEQYFDAQVPQTSGAIDSDRNLEMELELGQSDIRPENMVHELAKAEDVTKKFQRISVELRENVHIVRCLSDKLLDEALMVRIGKELCELVTDCGARNVVLDCGNIEYMASFMFGKLITFNKVVSEAKGRWMMCSVGPDLYEPIELTRLNKLFQIVDDLDTALKVLRQGTDEISDAIKNAVEKAIASDSAAKVRDGIS